MLATTSLVLEELQDLLLIALAEPLPFMSSQNFHRNHVNETNLELVSLVYALSQSWWWDHLSQPQANSLLQPGQWDWETQILPA